tara:strand:+ start:499 stop:4350 length:3852 start_codon:yes stop_codon:yes gene_type:complete
MSRLSFIKKISINSAILNQNRDNLNDDRIVTLQTSFEQTARRGEDPLTALQGLRMRILVATSTRSAQINDFVSQRFNEYLSLGGSPVFISEERYIRKMNTDLQEKLFINFFDINPLGPYVSYDQTVNGLFSPQAPQINAPTMSMASREIQVPLNTIMYDIELDRLLPRDPQTNEVPRPRYVRGSITDLEETVLTPIPISLNSVLPNIVVPNEINLNQMTFYAFIYSPSIPDVPGLDVPRFESIQTLNTGMSQIEVANVRGTRTLFPPITLGDYPMLGEAFAGAGEEAPERLANRNPLSPKFLFIPDFMANAGIFNPETREQEGDIFQTFNIGLEQEINTSFSKIYDLFYGDIFATSLFGGKGAKNVIKDNNYFSDFYLSRDLSDNARYTFAFDIRSFLAKNSYFPYLYLNRHSSDQLIEGTGLLDMAPRSRVLTATMKRRRVDKISQNLGNNLGTDSRTRVIGPSNTFPIDILDSPRTVKVFQKSSAGTPFVPEMSTKKIIFYEGEDIFGETKVIRGPKGETYNIPNGENQLNGEFQYGADLVVFDNAPEYVRRLVNLLRQHRFEINQIYDTITLSVPTPEGYRGGIVTNDRNLFDYASSLINVSLNDIETFIGSERQFVSDVLNRILASVNTEVQALVNLRELGIQEGSIAPYFQRQFEVPKVDPRYLLDLDNMIGLLIGFFKGRLTEIFPNDPYGDLVNYQPNLFRSSGYTASAIPIKRAEHWFSNTFSRGQTYHYGNDFIFRDEQMEKKSGLNSISTADYKTRVQDEFKKYFQSLTRGTLDYNEIPEPYLSPAVKYLTPTLIQTPKPPERENVNQPDYVSRTGNRVTYNINRYATMFADIGKLNFQNKYLNRLFNTIDDNDPHSSPNVNLFTSVFDNLSSYYATDIQVGETKVYQAPLVQIGEFPLTIPRRDYTWTSSDEGTFRYRPETPPIIPSIVGGPLLTGFEAPDESIYRTEIGNTIEAGFDRTKIDAEKQRNINSRRNQSSMPIKLPFAIFGEIFVDSAPIFNTNYQDKMFNSLTRLASVLGINPQNVASSIENLFSGFPNQTKSALVLAASDTVNQLGGEPVIFDAVRPQLEDQDSGDVQDLISYYKVQQGLDNDTYPVTRDPAKVYAKFLAFWMNYKNIAIVEYLSGYGDLNTNPGVVKQIYNGFERDAVKDLNLESKTRIPIWQPLTDNIISQIEGQEENNITKLLCRVRLNSSQEMNSLIDPKTAQQLEGNTITEEFFGQKPMITLSTYNRYFFLQSGEVTKSPPKENPPKSPPLTLGGAMGSYSDSGDRR